MKNNSTPISYFFIVAFLLIWVGVSAQISPIVEVIPISPTPVEKEVSLQIIFPRPHENKRKRPVNVQLRLKNFRLGVKTLSKREYEIREDLEGQSIHVIIDDHPYMVYSHSIQNLFGKEEEKIDKIVSFPIPFSLTPGSHLLRCFPAFSSGESVKGANCFQAEVFYFQDRRRLDTLNFDPSAPYITYNEPQGYYLRYQSDSILLDFYLSNCDLSPNGYKVRLSIDGVEVSLLTEWVPYYLKGLGPGRHTVQLELLDKNGEIVSGYFSKAMRTIVLE